jgi:dTDP-4-dehydrorhamnose 3,5-epimerase
MKIETTPIRDVLVITPEVHEDERGYFMESFRQDKLTEAGLNEVFVQDNHSLSVVPNTIRGLHFQWDKPMAKLMRVTRGRAFMVAVDLRKGSPTLGKWFGLELNDKNKKQLYAPASFARGFQTLSPMCEVQYKCSAFFNPQAQGEIAWDDKDINIDWPIKEDPLTSDRNKHAPSLKDWLNREESSFFQY